MGMPADLFCPRLCAQQDCRPANPFDPTFWGWNLVCPVPTCPLEHVKTGRMSVIRSTQACYANSPPVPELAETSPHYREDVTETLQPPGPNLSLATPSSPRRLEEKVARLPGGEGDRPRDPHTSPRNAAEGDITRDYPTRPNPAERPNRGPDKDGLGFPDAVRGGRGP